MKLIKQILFILVLFIAVIILARNFVFKVVVERGVEAITGLPLRMGSLDIGLTKTSMQIQDLRIYNPEGFPDKVMLDMPEIYVDYNFLPLLQKKIHLSEVRIDVKEFMVVKNKEGAVNLDALKTIQTTKKGAAPKDEGPKAPPPEIKIDSLGLRIGKVIAKDYSKGEKPSVQEFNIGIDEKYENISNVNALVSVIVFKALANTSVGSLLNIDLGGLKNVVTGTLSGATDVATEALKTTSGVLNDLKNVIKLPGTGGQ